MTGYESKKKAAQDKLKQDAFDAWWDTRPRVNETNPCSVDSFEYWAWEGWHAALAQPEPVAYGMWDTMIGYGGRMMSVRLDKGQDGCTVPLYTTPPQRTWVGLTYDERYDCVHSGAEDLWDVALLIEAKLKEKNNGT